MKVLITPEVAGENVVVQAFVGKALNVFPAGATQSFSAKELANALLRGAYFSVAVYAENTNIGTVEVALDELISDSPMEERAIHRAPFLAHEIKTFTR